MTNTGADHGALKVRRGFVDGPDGQIHYREAGDGPPLLLLHLNSGTSTMYLPVMPYLSKHFRTIAMDYPGYGDSDAPGEPYTNIEQWGKAIIAFLDGMRLAKVHILGHMTGANFAVEVAFRYPDRVGRLVLSEVFNWNTPPRREAHERLHRVFPPADSVECLAPLWDRAKALTQRDSKEVDYVNWCTQFVQSVRINMLNWYRGEDAARAYGVMGWDGAGPYSMCRQPVKEHMETITSPTLVMHGDKSILFRSHDSMAASVPGAEALVFAGGDFVSPLVEPAEWSKPILDFLLK